MSKRKKGYPRRTRHHRKPRSIGGTNSDNNIILLERDEHEAWHLLFGNKTAQEICNLINQKYLDPDYKFTCYRTLHRLCDDFWGEP